MTAHLTDELKRQECVSTETVSETPGAHGILSCSDTAQIVSYETNSALATLPSPKMGMVPRYISSKHHSGVSPLLQPLDGPCLSMGLGAPRTSVPAYCCHNRCLQHGLGRYMQQAVSLGASDDNVKKKKHSFLIYLVPQYLLFFILNTVDAEFAADIKVKVKHGKDGKLKQNINFILNYSFRFISSLIG